MAPSIPTTEPSSFRVGDTVKWTKSLSDFPASDGWVLTYEIRGAQKISTITASASGDDHAVTIAATTTADFIPGDYWWESYATLSGERYTAGSGQLVIKSNFATLTGNYDGRSDVKITLDAINDALKGKLTDAIQTIQIGGTLVANMTPEQLINAKSTYQGLYDQEQNEERKLSGKKAKNIIHSRFV